jgi:SAM-dependent methyltransferase
MKKKNSKQLLYSDKYENNFFVEKYAALWAYGYLNSFGKSEGLYRMINELGFSFFDKNIKHNILDIGCGVGRTSADYAIYFRNSNVRGIDSANLMINMACKINKSQKKIIFDMGRLGFGKISIKSQNINNLIYEEIMLKDFLNKSPGNSFDIITAVNFIDRVTDVKNHFKMIFNLLRNGGVFIFTSPLNFSNSKDWVNYGTFESILKLAKSTGFRVDIAFDGFIYEEILDARGAVEEYSTVVMRLIK